MQDQVTQTKVTETNPVETGTVSANGTAPKPNKKASANGAAKNAATKAADAPASAKTTKAATGTKKAATVAPDAKQSSAEGKAQPPAQPTAKAPAAIAATKAAGKTKVEVDLSKAKTGTAKAPKADAPKANAGAEAAKADAPALKGQIIKADPAAPAPGIAFDYNALDADTRKVLRQHETTIKAAMKRTQKDIIQIGGALEDAKNRLEHGVFGKWCEGVFGIGRVQANRFMAVWEHYGKMDTNTLANYQVSALYALTAPSVPAEIRDAAQKLAEGGETVTHGKAQELTGKATPATPAPTAEPQAAPAPVGKPVVGIIPQHSGETLLHAQNPDIADLENNDPFADELGTDTVDEVGADGTPAQTDEQWFAGLAIAKELEQFPTNYDICFADAKVVRGFLQSGLQGKLRFFVNAAKKEVEQTTPVLGDGLALLQDAANCPPPEQWKLCTGCKGCGLVYITKNSQQYEAPGIVAPDETNQLTVRCNKVQCDRCTKGCGYTIE